MKRQMTFSESEFASKKRVTRKEAFLAVMEQHESREGQRINNQFNPSGSTKELPNFGAPDGWGISQLDTPLGQSASTNEVYHGKVNVATFYNELNEKRQHNNGSLML